MKKTKLSAFFTKTSFVMAVFSAGILCSCSYGLHEFRFRNNAADIRTRHLLEISESDKPVIPAEGKYSVILISDVHFGAERETKPRKDGKFLEEIKNLSDAGEKPLFAICLGDIAEHGYKKEMESFVKELVEPLENDYGIKTYTIVGNHDLYNSGWCAFTETTFPGTSFFHFKTTNFSWYFLDSASDTLGDNQFSLMQNAMKKDPNPKLVFLHVPFYAGDRFYFKMQNTAERNKILSVFADSDVRGIFSGHTHIENTSNLGPFTEYTAGGYFASGSWMIIRLDEKDTNALYSVEFKRLD